MSDNQQLCPRCKTGYEQYMLDQKAPECPYMSVNNGRFCPFFENFEKSENEAGE